MVLVPVLYNNINPNTFNTYISSLPGNQPSSAHIRATMFSPGETPTKPRACAVILSSEETPTNRADHQPRICAVIFSPGETPTNRASTQPHRASGASQMGNPLQPPPPPTRRIRLPCYSRLCGFSLPDRVGIPLLVGGSNPLSEP